MRNLWCDTETESECDLKTYGTAAYAEHPSTKIQLFSYALDDGEVKLWSPKDGEPMPGDLEGYLNDPEILLWFHNAWFDRSVIENDLGIYLPLSRYRCTMAVALSHGLPGALDKLGDVLGVREDYKKMREGKRLVQLFCKPKKCRDGRLVWYDPKTHPEDWKLYKEYCKTDTASMREIAKKIQKWNYPRGIELDYWLLDQAVNSRGMCIDLGLAQAAMSAIEVAQVDLAKSTKRMTNGEVKAASQRDMMLEHILKTYDVPVPNMQKATLQKLLDGEETPFALKELLKVRLSTCTTSTAKYKKLVHATSRDGRLRGTIQFAGASRTLRDGGRVFQPQNLARPTLEHDEILEGIDKLKAGSVKGLDVMRLTSSALRYSICAPKGKKLIISDLAGIEGRVLAYLANESWKVKAYERFDAGVGPDLYKAAYAKAFAIDPDSVTKEQRQVGKVLELACLAGETLVLTDSGYKPIISVRLSDKVWDGLNWVSHKGVVYKGVKSTVNLDGARMTTDHEIYTDEYDFVYAGEAALSHFHALVCLNHAEKFIPNNIRKFKLKQLLKRTLFGKPLTDFLYTPVYDVFEAGPRNRFMIKTDNGHLIVHNCGYGGGVAAFITFAASATPPIDLSYLAERVLPSIPQDVYKEAEGFYNWLLKKDVDAAKRAGEKLKRDWKTLYKPTSTNGLIKEVHIAIDSLKRLWRREHPAVVQFWADTEGAVRNAITSSNLLAASGDITGRSLPEPRLEFPFGNNCLARRQGKWVRVILPSGHSIPYPGMEITDNKLQFKGVDQFTKRWGPIKTYGPKIVENIVQAFSRDIFKYGQLAAERAGYKVILPVHDENVCEVPDLEIYTALELAKIMSTNPPWAKGLPLAAKGFSDYRYHKDLD